MSFTTDVKAEIAQTNLETGAMRAQAAALIQLCSSISISSEGMQLIIRTENAATALTGSFRSGSSMASGTS